MNPGIEISSIIYQDHRDAGNRLEKIIQLILGIEKNNSILGLTNDASPDKYRIKDEICCEHQRHQKRIRLDTGATRS